MLRQVYDLIQELSPAYQLRPELVVAIATVETGGVSVACRYEPKWHYFERPEEFAIFLGQSIDTEKIQQATSWGAMQVMGSVARELGFRQHLVLLSDAETGIKYGCMKLASLRLRWTDERDIISAYNAGSPKRFPNGQYVNQEYVTKVLKILNQGVTK